MSRGATHLSRGATHLFRGGGLPICPCFQKLKLVYLEVFVKPKKQETPNCKPSVLEETGNSKIQTLSFGAKVSKNAPGGYPFVQRGGGGYPFVQGVGYPFVQGATHLSRGATHLSRGGYPFVQGGGYPFVKGGAHLSRGRGLPICPGGLPICPGGAATHLSRGGATHLSRGGYPFVQGAIAPCTIAGCVPRKSEGQVHLLVIIIITSNLVIRMR